MADRIFATTGRPARIGGVHVDAITTLGRQRGYRRATQTLESGAPLTVHRKRKPEAMTISVIVSDVEPIFGASFTPLWEGSHASKVEARLQEVMGSSEEITIWTGREFLRTPDGSQVWVIDDISDDITAPERGVYRATLTIGESRRAPTAFSSSLPDVDPALGDVTAEPSDRGRQSTAAVSPDADASIAAGSTP